MTTRQIRIFELVLVLSISFMPSFFASLIYIFTGRFISDSGYNSADYVISIFQSLLSVLLMFYVLYKNDKDYKNIGLNLKFKWRDIFESLLLMIASGIAISILLGFIKIISPEFAEQSTNPQNLEVFKTQSRSWLLVFLIIIPIQEELIVRGFTMSEIFKLTESKTFAITISVGIQFAYHLYQGLAPALLMLPYFIIISFYFIKTGNLNPVIFSHILIDIINGFLRQPS